MKKLLLTLVISLLLLASVVMAIEQASPVEQPTSASVGVNEYIDFTITVNNATAGLNFGDLNPNTNDNPAIPNPIVTLTVGSPTNIDVHIYLKGTDFDDGSGHTLSVSNVKYDDDGTLGEGGSETDWAEGTLSTGYQASPGWGTITAPAGGPAETKDVYHWLSVPSGQYAGSYTSTFTYKADRA